MKLHRLIIAAAIAAAALLTTAPAHAREMSLGLNAGYASYNDGAYAAINFKIDLAKHVRLAQELGYAFRNEGKSAFLMSVDVDFPFRVAKGFNIYPLCGFTLNSWSYKGHDDNATRAGVDIGGGFDFYVTRNLKLNLQAKYSLMNDTDGAFVGAGIAYVF